MPVEEGAKVLEIDPRESGYAEVFGIGARPGRIAESVLRVVQEEP